MPFLTFCIGRAPWSIWQSLLLLLFYSPSQESCQSLRAAAAAARGTATPGIGKALKAHPGRDPGKQRVNSHNHCSHRHCSAPHSGNCWAPRTWGDPNTGTPQVETEWRDSELGWNDALSLKVHSTTAEGRLRKRHISCPNTGAQISGTNETWVSHSQDTIYTFCPPARINLHLWSLWLGVQCRWPKDSFIDQWGSQFWQISDNWQIHPKWCFQNGNLMNKYA